MKIKNLLVGSVLALTANGAFAADAVYAPEPEPVEYVRVCDAYGAGFFYIPGTETCLQDDNVDTFSFHYGPAAEDGWRKNVQARINFDARSDTEWGTLRSYIRFQASWTPNGSLIPGTTTVQGDGFVATDQAYLQLGGFMAGYSESFWVDSKNGGASNWGSHSWGGMSYGYLQRALLGYRFEAGDFFGAISLEDDALAGEGYMPDLVAKLGYSGGWGAVWAKVAYDESIDSIAAQVGGQLNIPNMPGSSLRVIGYYSESITNAYGIYYDTAAVGPLRYGAAEWSILASYRQQFSDTLSASVGFQYFDGFTGVADAYLAELSVVWLPLPLFEVRGEVAYADTEGLDGTVSGFLRFTRYF
jgi:hypothetical protein